MRILSNTRRSSARIALLAAALSLFGAASHAATLTGKDDAEFQFNAKLSDSNTGAGVQKVGDSSGSTRVFRAPLSIDKFDPTLGRLSAINVQWGTEATRGLFSVGVICRDSGIIDQSCEDSSSSQTNSSSIEIDLPGDGAGLRAGARSGSYSVAQAAFSEFVGTGSIDVSWAITFFHSVSGTCDPNLGTFITRCDLSGSGIFKFTAHIQVDYEYDPISTPPNVVPLPAGLPLLLAGLGSLAYLRRRKG